MLIIRLQNLSPSDINVLRQLGVKVRNLSTHPNVSPEVRLQMADLADALFALPDIDVDFSGILKATNSNIGFVRLCFSRGRLSFTRQAQISDGDPWAYVGSILVFRSTNGHVNYLGRHALDALLDDFDKIREAGPAFCIASTHFDKCG